MTNIPNRQLKAVKICMGRNNIKYQELPDEKLTELTGVKKQDFETMISVLTEAHKRNNIFIKKTNPLSIELMLILTAEYLRGNDTLMGLGQKYNTYPNYTCDIVRWVVSTLGRNRLSTKLPTRRA